MEEIAISQMKSNIQNLSGPALAASHLSISSDKRHPCTILAKRIMDCSIASLALVFLTPLLLIVALFIKIDSSGPVIFFQTRRGLNGVPFKILKFRTMTVLEDGNLIAQAKRGDARVTRLGRWLRRTSIDELPQLLNVIRGDMALVGPRPHAISHDDYYSKIIESYNARQSIKPGITGWAQVNGARGETPDIADMRRRVELDLWYIQNWSLLLDIRILFSTALQIVRNPDAF